MGVIDFAKHLFGRNKEILPEGVRVYAVGDVHGRQDLLGDLLERIRADIALEGNGKTIAGVFLGDYIDRGRDSRLVVDCLLEARSDFDELVFLKGNHEATLLNFLDDASVLDAWKNFGGLETLHSYGVDVTGVGGRTANKTAREDFLRKLPADHYDFFRDLRTSYEIGGYFFCHAGVRPGLPISRQSEADLLWIRDEFLDSTANHGKVVVHGHTPVDEVEFWDNRINVDTGAYISNNLSCIVLDGISKNCL